MKHPLLDKKVEYKGEKGTIVGIGFGFIEVYFDQGGNKRIDFKELKVIEEDKKKE